jgi:hypothetical protein
MPLPPSDRAPFGTESECHRHYSRSVCLGLDSRWSLCAHPDAVHPAPLHDSNDHTPAGASVAKSTWTLTNTTTQAVFNENFYVNNVGHTYPDTADTSVFDGLRFTLTESVNYAVTGSITVNLREDGFAHWARVSVLLSHMDSHSIAASQQGCLARSRPHP